MTTLFWACKVPNQRGERPPSPAQRLALACEVAQRNLGTVPPTVHLHPETAAETPVPLGMTLVPDEHVHRRQEYRFVREPLRDSPRHRSSPDV